MAFLTFLDFGQFGPVKKTKIVPNQLSEPLNLSKMTVFDASTLASLVSHKIWVARKSLNFHTVPVKFRWFSKFHTSRDNFRIFTQKKSLVRIFLLFQILVVLVVVLKAQKNYVKSSFSRNHVLFSRNFSHFSRKTHLDFRVVVFKVVFVVQTRILFRDFTSFLFVQDKGIDLKMREIFF